MITGDVVKALRVAASAEKLAALKNSAHGLKSDRRATCSASGHRFE
jgi:hypothetical protein